MVRPKFTPSPAAAPDPKRAQRRKRAVAKRGRPTQISNSSPDSGAGDSILDDLWCSLPLELQFEIAKHWWGDPVAVKKLLAAGFLQHKCGDIIIKDFFNHEFERLYKGVYPGDYIYNDLQNQIPHLKSIYGLEGQILDRFERDYFPSCTYAVLLTERRTQELLTLFKNRPAAHRLIKLARNQDSEDDDFWGGYLETYPITIPEDTPGGHYYFVGRRYKYGEGVPRGMDEALCLFAFGAAQQHPLCMYEIAIHKFEREPEEYYDELVELLDTIPDIIESQQTIDDISFRQEQQFNDCIAPALMLRLAQYHLSQRNDISDVIEYVVPLVYNYLFLPAPDDEPEHITTAREEETAAWFVSMGELYYFFLVLFRIVEDSSFFWFFNTHRFCEAYKDFPGISTEMSRFIVKDMITQTIEDRDNHLFHCAYLGNWRDSEFQYCRQYWEMFQDNDDVLWFGGELFVFQNRHDPALQIIEQDYKSNPAGGGAFLKALCELYKEYEYVDDTDDEYHPWFSFARLERVYELLHECIALNPQRPSLLSEGALLVMGLCMGHQDRAREAVESFQSAMLASPHPERSMASICFAFCLLGGFGITRDPPRAAALIASLDRDFLAAMTNLDLKLWCHWLGKEEDPDFALQLQWLKEHRDMLVDVNEILEDDVDFVVDNGGDSDSVGGDSDSTFSLSLTDPLLQSEDDWETDSDSNLSE
ncbi:uncharacterized protein BJ171DRAFT_517321 [Polychytrium aggregatum]|uniref:uncharacterized protein n=1 Tax=Polychytrium aggregatum TaxID=110093 RepID=UPI0022FE9F53|nr:uncharacterized protein BJ171DRAFT_517321 [Polychytrium aggregatum]KAI9199882.1 hypothetical protein BJ171DRAFT_517321 [Polychytrium aggregatum]